MTLTQYEACCAFHKGVRLTGGVLLQTLRTVKYNHHGIIKMEAYTVGKTLVVTVDIHQFSLKPSSIFVFSVSSLK